MPAATSERRATSSRESREALESSFWSLGETELRSSTMDARREDWALKRTARRLGTRPPNLESEARTSGEKPKRSATQRPWPWPRSAKKRKRNEFVRESCWDMEREIMRDAPVTKRRSVTTSLRGGGCRVGRKKENDTNEERGAEAAQAAEPVAERGNAREALAGLEAQT